MSAFGKSVTAAIAGLALSVGGVVTAAAQGPWVAPRCVPSPSAVH